MLKTEEKNTQQELCLTKPHWTLAFTEQSAELSWASSVYMIESTLASGILFSYKESLRFNCL